MAYGYDPNDPNRKPPGMTTPPAVVPPPAPRPVATPRPSAPVPTPQHPAPPVVPPPTQWTPQNEQQQTAQMKAGSFADDSADAGNWNTGDAYLDELRSGKVAGSEDWRRMSNAQMKAWQQFYVGNGKFKNIYGDIVDKPDDVGPNTPQGFNGTGDRIGSTGDGNGGGAGGVVPGPSSGGAVPQGFAQSSLDEMTNFWKDLTKNSGSRYTPEAMAALEADQFARARAQEKLQLEQNQGDMAQRGMARSANQNAAVRQIGVGTGNQIMANRSQIQKAKIDADFQDKQAAIKNAQDWVNSMRDYMLRTDMNSIQREQMAAQIRLAEMNIRAQSSLLKQQYDQQSLLNEQNAALGSYRDFTSGL